jgi:hypothetical protein
MAMLTRGKKLIIRTKYGDLSRGKCWGKFYAGKDCAAGDFVWAAKRGGQLVIDEAGYLVYGSDDGFSRRQKAEMLIEWRQEEAAPAAKPAPEAIAQE